MTRKERHVLILELLTGLRRNQAVTVRWLARQMRLGGQRSLISKDCRELEQQGLVRIRIALDALSETITTYPRNRCQKILIVRAVAHEGAPSG